jgi:hypothetical protein
MKRISLEEDFKRIERDHSKAPYFPEESLSPFQKDNVTNTFAISVIGFASSVKY